MPSHHNRPLAVDLDGTLIHTDLLHECLVRLIKKKPYLLFILPFWLLQGKAKFKEKVAQSVHLNIHLLPFNSQLINWLKVQKQEGRKLILCTASDISLANAVATHLNLFDEVMASQDGTNLSGLNKAAHLIATFGIGQFDYAGNSKIDLLVWSSAKNAIVVNGSNALIRQAKLCTTVESTFSKSQSRLKDLIKALRIHQWIKNALLFIPLLAAHEVTSSSSFIQLFIGFLAFSFCASAVYVINDLFDLESDRNHIRKKYRPFAAGDLPIALGIALAPLLLISSFLLAAYVGTNFFICLFIYWAITCIYTLRLKQLALIDCLTLAILYTLRIVAGAVAVSVVLSFWLLAFSIFLFLSLAFLKRYAELKNQSQNSNETIMGRGYITSDFSLIQQFGITSGYTSVLVLALYLNSEAVMYLYQTPQIIWAAIPTILFWLSWMWLKAHRGLMEDDPILFAIKDKTSLVSGALVIAVFLLAMWW